MPRFFVAQELRCDPRDRSECISPPNGARNTCSRCESEEVLSRWVNPEGGCRGFKDKEVH